MALKESEPQLSDSHWNSFSQNFHYMAGGYDDFKAYQALSKMLDQVDQKTAATSGNRIFYLSTPLQRF